MGDFIHKREFIVRWSSLRQCRDCIISVTLEVHSHVWPIWQLYVGQLQV